MLGLVRHRPNNRSLVFLCMHAYKNPLSDEFLRWKESLANSDHPFATDVAQLDLESFRQWIEEEFSGHSESSLLALRAYADVCRRPWLSDIDSLNVSPKFVGQYPISLARRFNIVGAQDDGDQLLVVGGSPYSPMQLDHIRRLFRCPTRFCFAHPQHVKQLIESGYQLKPSETLNTIADLDRESVDSLRIESGGEDLLASSGKSPVVKLANSILFDAIKERASDIHIQPYENHLQVRFRIDGLLFDQFEIPKEKQEELLSRIKVMGKMNIAEKRLPQDGRASVAFGDRNIDLRIASLPTSFGERVVIRLLDKGARLYTLEELGMPQHLMVQFRKLIHREHGLFLVTGPTGSGKSTTLYAALQEINSRDKNVVTLEDPIEYQLNGISQTQINEKKGMTFAKGLRNILRQDPDIIMVGEIRDQETAEMAIQSALTGHMVYSTLHTNDATSAVTRLLDLGIEPYLVASSLVGVLAQRLVRRICQDCKRSLKDNSADNQESLAYEGVGCENCRQTGFRGRVGLFELMSINEQVQGLIQKRSAASKIGRMAVSQGMHRLRESGLQLVQQGQTTLSEVLRVASESD